jgi:hypothetical protein
VLECFVDGFGVWTWSVSPEVGGVGLFFTVVILDLQKKRFIPLVLLEGGLSDLFGFCVRCWTVFVRG